MGASRVQVTTLASLGFFCFVTVASAAIIGDLKTSSGAGTTTVTLSSITFNPDTNSNPPGPPWNGEVTNTTSLMFSGCASGTLGAAGCLDAAPNNPSEGVLFANGNPIVLGNPLTPNNPFIQFAGNGVTHATLLYTITGAGPGSANTNCAGLAIGDSCSVFAGSPIILTLSSTGTNVNLSVFGTATDGAGTSNWIGNFSTPITGMTPSQIQLFFCPSGTCKPADFAGTNSITKPSGGDFLASVVPEPATIAMGGLGLGLILLAGIRRKMVR